MSERTFKTKLSNKLTEKEFFTFNTHEISRAGVPDVYACKNGKSIWIELKQSATLKLKHPLSVRQAAFLRDINRVKGLGLVLISHSNGKVSWHRVTKAATMSDFSHLGSHTLDEFIQFLCSFTTKT